MEVASHTLQRDDNFLYSGDRNAHTFLDFTWTIIPGGKFIFHDASVIIRHSPVINPS